MIFPFEDPSFRLMDDASSYEPPENPNENEKVSRRPHSLFVDTRFIFFTPCSPLARRETLRARIYFHARRGERFYKTHGTSLRARSIKARCIYDVSRKTIGNIDVLRR